MFKYSLFGAGFIFCVVLLDSGFALAILDDTFGGSKTLDDQMKVLVTRMTAAQSAEVSALKKEIDSLRQEIRSHPPPGNDVRNSQLTLEWARGALAELRGEMQEARDTAKAAAKEREHLASLLAAAQAEARGSTALLAEQAVGEARREEQLGELKTRVEATERMCRGLQREMKLKQLEWTMDLRTTGKRLPTDTSNLAEDLKPQGKQEGHDSRHMRFIRKQLQFLLQSNRKLTKGQDFLSDRLFDLQIKLEFISSVNTTEGVQKLEDVIKQQKKNTKIITNLTIEVDNFNKLHISMLELLENVENLESKVDKTIPDIEKEISKLGIDMAQANSHNAYLKENQENIKQSVKAIAVGVSNMVDKVNEDHALLQKINGTVQHLQGQSKQHFYRLTDHISKSEANLPQNSSSDYIPSLMGELQELKNAQKEFEDIVSQLPTSCETVEGPSGNYLIAPGTGSPVRTACQDGWTLVQRRTDGQVDFNRNYKEYAAGFGTPSGEFWIGNDALSRLTTDNCSSLRIDMVDIYGKSWVANYASFHVASAAAGYRLTVDGFSGNASDALEYQNRMEFSTVDKDRDISNTHCAVNYEGGWWFSHCQHANLNGKYALGLTWFDKIRNEWIAVTSSRITLRTNQSCVHRTTTTPSSKTN